MRYRGHHRHTLRSFDLHSFLQHFLFSLNAAGVLADLIELRFCPLAFRAHLIGIICASRATLGVSRVMLAGTAEHEDANSLNTTREVLGSHSNGESEGMACNSRAR